MTGCDFHVMRKTFSADFHCMWASCVVTTANGWIKKVRWAFQSGGGGLVALKVLGRGAPPRAGGGGGGGRGGGGGGVPSAGFHKIHEF